MRLFIFLLSLYLGVVANAGPEPGGGYGRGPGRGPDRGSDQRIVRCERENRDLNDRVRQLENQLYQCQTFNRREPMWSCQAGCQGLGNVGFGSGRTKAEAQQAALKDLGFTCSRHTFDCIQEN